MTATSPIPSTRNEAWGFWGTLAERADAAWPLAMSAISDATGQPLEPVRAFLDSRRGRHFADDVHNGIHAGLVLEAAIDAAITRWMGWKIDRNTAREHGMPKGLPYLTGFVGLYEIMADAE